MFNMLPLALEPRLRLFSEGLIERRRLIQAIDLIGIHQSLLGRGRRRVERKVKQIISHGGKTAQQQHRHDSAYHHRNAQALRSLVHRRSFTTEPRICRLI